MQPEPGVEYPLHLGSSLLSRGEQGATADEYCTLRYDFKPASAGRAAAGQMDVQLGNQKVRTLAAALPPAGPPPLPPAHTSSMSYLQAASQRLQTLWRMLYVLPPAPPLAAVQVALQMGEAAFAGKYEPSKDGLDCIAIFDGTSLRLELLGATVKNLRCAAEPAALPFAHKDPEGLDGCPAPSRAPQASAGKSGAGTPCSSVSEGHDGRAGRSLGSPAPGFVLDLTPRGCRSCHLGCTPLASATTP